MTSCSQECETIGNWVQSAPRPPSPGKLLFFMTGLPHDRTGQKVPMWEKSHCTSAGEKDASEVEASLPNHTWIVTCLNSNIKFVFKLLFILKVSHQKLTGDFGIHSQLSKQTATLWYLQLDSYTEKEVLTAGSIYRQGPRNAVI